MKTIFFILSLFATERALAAAGDLSSALKQASETTKQWGTDAMLLVCGVTVGIALITKFYCPRWAERIRDNAWATIGGACFMYAVFYFFGDSIKAAFKENLNFWQWFGL